MKKRLSGRNDHLIFQIRVYWGGDTQLKRVKMSIPIIDEELDIEIQV